MIYICKVAHIKILQNFCHTLVCVWEGTSVYFFLYIALYVFTQPLHVQDVTLGQYFFKWNIAGFNSVFLLLDWQSYQG